MVVQQEIGAEVWSVDDKPPTRPSNREVGRNSRPAIITLYEGRAVNNGFWACPVFSQSVNHPRSVSGAGLWPKSEGGGRARRIGIEINGAGGCRSIERVDDKGRRNGRFSRRGKEGEEVVEIAGYDKFRALKIRQWKVDRLIRSRLID